MTHATRRAWAAFLLTGAVLVHGAIGQAAGAQEGPVTIRTSAPATVEFGDPFTARIAVLAQRDAVDVRTLDITESIAPLTPLTATRVSRFSRGALDVVALEVRAACLDQSCVSPRGARSLELPPVRVDGTARDGSSVSVMQRWPKLTVRGRVSSADLDQSRPPFRADVDVPGITYRASPDTLVLLLGAAAAVLTIAAFALSGLELVRIRRSRRSSERDELEWALALVRAAEARPASDRRRAVGLLARVLRHRRQQLSEPASALAWSAREPTPAALAGLADRVVGEVESS